MSVIGRFPFVVFMAASSFLPPYSIAHAQNNMDAYIDRVLRMSAMKPKTAHQVSPSGNRYVQTYSSRTFGGYDCTNNCSGHKAGYEWAERNDITDEYDCVSNSVSFDDGCAVYVDDPYRDADFDDNGIYVP